MIVPKKQLIFISASEPKSLPDVVASKDHVWRYFSFVHLYLDYDIIKNAILLGLKFFTDKKN